MIIMDLARSQEAIVPLRTNLNQTLIGKAEVVEKVIACILARGHLLFDDLPGLGKTTLAKAIAQSIGGQFARIQCTPDLLPGDITGFSILNQKTREFEFRQGPVFSDVLLADEINRATPRTQSALFEAMAERQVTVDNQTFGLAEQFFVVATQNPVESHGAYPLPEAQLDRFAMKLRIGYPDTECEVDLLEANIGRSNQKSGLSPALSLESLARIQDEVAGIQVVEKVRRYLVDLARATRTHALIELGLSPRGLITWQRVAQAMAFLDQRDFVTPDDIRESAHPVLELRVPGDPQEQRCIIDEILDQVAVPLN